MTPLLKSEFHFSAQPLLRLQALIVLGQVVEQTVAPRAPGITAAARDLDEHRRIDVNDQKEKNSWDFGLYVHFYSEFSR